ncbi:transposase [Rubrivirga sp. S365]|uniref:transposase n=1 Tax=Rubrivirga sp. S365 TaxID=3076080 RepID=UPI0028C878A5|nr:transposase [Rubrivirga sp. S365]MDT7858159.1 transposase [Rubrivirga sp. S365]
MTDTPDPSAAGDGPPPEPSGAASPTYRHEGPAVSAIVYYVLLVTRRRRPLFEDAAVKARAEELVVASAEGAGLGVRFVDVAPATVTVHVEAPPTMSPHEVVRAIRQPTASALKAEFEAVRRAHSVFVRRYLVTTMPVPEMDGAAFERSVPKR